MKIRITTITITAIILGVSVLDLVAQKAIPVPEGEEQKELGADPGNDYFSRVNQIYKMALATKDLPERDQYFKQVTPMLLDYLKQFPVHKNAEPANYYLAECYFNTGLVRESMVVYKGIVDKYKTGPYVAVSAYRLARDFYSKSDFLTAAQYFGKTAECSTEQADKTKALNYQADSYIKAKKPELAAPILEKVAGAEGVNPFKEQAALAFGKLSLKEGKYQNALTSFEKLIDPSQPEKIQAEASYLAGVAANGLKNTELAEKFFKMNMLGTSIEWKGQAQTGLMIILFAKKDYRGVISLMDRGTYEMPANFKAKQGFFVGHSHFILEQYPSAIDSFINVEIHGKGTDEAFKAGYYKLLCFYHLKNDNIPEKVDRFLEGYAVNNGRHKFIHQALLMKAESCYSEKKYEEAAKVYSAIGVEHMDKKYLPGLLFRKAHCLSKVGNFAGAVSSISELLKNHPESANLTEALLIRADAYAKLEDKVNALRDYDQVIKEAKDPQNTAVALQKSGIIQFHAEQYEDMIERYQKLVEAFPNIDAKIKANANYWIGNAYFKQKKYKQGLKYLDDCMKLDEVTFAKQITMYKVIGHFSLRHHEDTEKAVELAEKAGLRENDSIPLEVYRWLGEYHYNNNDFKKAVAQLEKGLEKGPANATDAAIWRYLSKAQIKIGEHEKAFLSVSNLLSMEEEPARVVDAMLDKAQIQMALGKDGDGKRTAEAALEMNPVGRVEAELLRVIGDFYHNTGDSEKAANHYVLLLETAKTLPVFPQILDRLSFNLEKAGNTAEAKRYADQLKAEFPDYKREE